MTIEELVGRALLHDLDAFGELVRRFQSMAVGYAYSILQNFAEAEEVAQEAFIHAYQRLPDLQDHKAFPGWFRTTLFREAQRILRKRQPGCVPLEHVMDHPFVNGVELVEKRDVRNSVLEAIASLPEREREVLTLFYIKEHSMSEIGAFLQVPASTVKSRLHAARNKLKEKVIDMLEESLAGAAPKEDFTKNVLDKLRVAFGRWEMRDDILHGACEENCLGFAFAKHAWPGDAVVIEYDGMTIGGIDSPALGAFMLPFASEEERQRLDPKTPYLNFCVPCANVGKYKWVFISDTFQQGRWSRDGSRFYGRGDFCGIPRKWYHVKGERIGQMLRIWVDGVPVCERRIDTPPPERLYVALRADTSYNQFRNIQIYRPDPEYIEQYNRPIPLFAPYQQRLDILSNYPDQIVREASIDFSSGVAGEGLQIHPNDAHLPFLREEGCLKSDAASGKYHLRLRLTDPDAWGDQNLVRLEVEYYDEGEGTFAALYPSWYSAFVSTDDVFFENKKTWKRAAFILRDCIFRGVPQSFGHISFEPLRNGKGDLRIRNVRVTEIAKADAAYEAVLDAYRIEVDARSDEWTVPLYKHAMFQCLLILKRDAEARTLWDSINRDYPLAECIDMEMMKASAVQWRY